MLDSACPVKWGRSKSSKWEEVASSHRRDFSWQIRRAVRDGGSLNGPARRAGRAVGGGSKGALDRSVLWSGRRKQNAEGFRGAIVGGMRSGPTTSRVLARAAGSDHKTTGGDTYHEQEALYRYRSAARHRRVRGVADGGAGGRTTVDLERTFSKKA